MSKAKRIATFPDMGIEAWVRFDASAELYEVFASAECDDYIGCADTMREAHEVARQWFDERMSY